MSVCRNLSYFSPLFLPNLLLASSLSLPFFLLVYAFFSRLPLFLCTTSCLQSVHRTCNYYYCRPSSYQVDIVLAWQLRVAGRSVCMRCYTRRRCWSEREKFLCKCIHIIKPVAYNLARDGERGTRVEQKKKRHETKKKKTKRKKKKIRGVSPTQTSREKLRSARSRQSRESLISTTRVISGVPVAI